MQMNNKGQVLVIFIIILPILLLILGMVVDLGLISIEKRKISNNAYDAVENYLEYNDEQKVKKILETNLDDIEIIFTNEEEYIEITVTKHHKGLYSVIFKDEIINIKYRGIKETKEIIKG